MTQDNGNGNGNGFPQIVRAIRDSHGLRNGKFADLVGVTAGSVTRWLKGTRTPTTPEIGKLLQVAAPEQQVAMLSAMGVEDVQQFAADILAAAGIPTVFADDPAAVLGALDIESAQVVNVQSLS